MKVLVTGGTGMVGTEVVRELTARGAEVSVLTRDPAKTASLPARVKAVAGNLLAPRTVREIFNDVDGVFLLNAVSQTESHEALLALCGMQLAGVSRVVYLSVLAADHAAFLPHFGSKAGVEQALRRSGLPFTILRPNNFFQNDIRLRDAIVQAGIYPQPLGSRGVSRVDIRDIADAAATTLLTSGHEGQTYDLNGPDKMTGQSVAAAWSLALEREIRYAGDDLDAWERQSLQFMPDWMVFDFRMMFDFFQKNGFTASEHTMARQAQLLGHAPRSFAAFAKEMAEGWKDQGA